MVEVTVVTSAAVKGKYIGNHDLAGYNGALVTTAIRLRQLQRLRWVEISSKKDLFTALSSNVNPTRLSFVICTLQSYFLIKVVELLTPIENVKMCALIKIIF